MDNNLDDYIMKPYTRILIPNEDGTYSAEILEFTGCFADGATADEAMENITEAAKSWIDACLEQGIDIPEPFMNQNFGGKIALRLPRSLHRQAVRFAVRDGVSLNQFLVSAVAAKVGAEDAIERLIDKYQRNVTTTAQNFVYIDILQAFRFDNTQESRDISNLNYLPKIQNRISTEVIGQYA